MSQLGKQILQSRKNKGISQEELAEIAKINLRTLQRIEKGETTPHGDTLKRISEALGLPIQDLVSYGLTENYGYIKALHFSAIIFIILPLGNILLPLIMWLVKKDEVKDLNYFAKKLINAQITWSIIVYLPFALSIMGWFSDQMHLHFNISRFLTWIYPLLLYFLNIIYLIIAGILIKDRRQNIFPLAIPFIR